MLGKWMSLEEIAEQLNVQKVPDSRREQMDSCICSEVIRFLEALWRAMMSAFTGGLDGSRVGQSSRLPRCWR
jgi:hypothetical protein